MLFKEQENLLKRAALYKNSMRYPLGTPDLTGKDEPNDTSHSKRNLFGMKMHTDGVCKIDNTVQNQSISIPDDDADDDDDDMSTKSPLEEMLSKRAGSYFKENFRFNPMNSCTETTSSTSHKEKSSSSSTSSSPSPLIKPVPESSLLQDCSSIEEETKCVVCNAVFPSVWLLEQHAALQHANLGPMEEKPFICEQCGQSYRYRSAYVKHREQNHRARLPADKLFTCDVCGMQFRYLKSFKKHRLNHALERLHGKCEKRAQQMATTSGGTSESNNEMVTSSNETLTDEIAELQFAIKAEEEEEDQDDTIDSPIGTTGSIAETQPNFIGVGPTGPARISRSDILTTTSPPMHEDASFILKVTPIKYKSNCQQALGWTIYIGSGCLSLIIRHFN